MNAIELFHSDGKPAGIFYCEKCRIAKRTKEEAAQCCAPAKCEDCGSEALQHYYTVCDPCRHKRDTAREAERFANAEKVTEWNGVILHGSHGYNDGFFRDIDELDDWPADEAEEDGTQPDRPEYVWTCDDQCFCQLDYCSIIEHATQEAYEDWDSRTIAGQAELKAAIATFNAANAHHATWHPNYKRALILAPLIPDQNP